MSRITQITAPDGSVTTVRTRSQCGCVTAFLVLLVLAIPAVYFGRVGAVLAYVALAVAVGAWIWRAVRKRAVTSPPTAPPAGRASEKDGGAIA
jgi:hypothetical protein